jgi:uncharacterized membrane protein
LQYDFFPHLKSSQLAFAKNAILLGIIILFFVFYFEKKKIEFRE